MELTYSPPAPQSSLAAMLVGEKWEVMLVIDTIVIVISIIVVIIVDIIFDIIVIVIVMNIDAIVGIDVDAP